MNQIEISLTLEEASVVLYALRHAKAALNLPELCGVIDTIEVSRAEVMRDVSPDDEPFDGFRTDAEADADALASAGYGTDEDYCPSYEMEMDEY